MSSGFDVTCVGESLVDFVSMTSADSLADVPAFVKVAGGAPLNVAVGVARLGRRSAFVGKVGNDSFGRFLKRELKKTGVDTRGVVADEKRKTRLAFVSVSRDGERDFEFWERHPADQELRLADVDLARVFRSRIVHIGSFLLLNNPARTTVLRVAEAARHEGCEVCFDPNLRLSVWRSQREARSLIRQMAARSSILRMNDQEARFVTGARGPENSAMALRGLGPDMVLITCAEKGCFYSCNESAGFVTGFKVKPVDTTGCGDGFLAGVLSAYCNIGKEIKNLTSDDMEGICRVGNAVGALTALKRGAVSALPSARELTSFLRARRAKT